MERDIPRGSEMEAGELKKLVEARTHRRIQDLDVHMSSGRLVLTGRAGSYHLKQLAQHGILDVFPGIHLINAIEVWN
jgi:hypothetical protein